MTRKNRAESNTGVRRRASKTTSGKGKLKTRPAGKKIMDK